MHGAMASRENHAGGPRDEAFADRTARRVYRALFAEQPPASVIERFREPFTSLCGDATPTEVSSLRAAIDRVNNLSALEIAARYTHRVPLLVAAFRLMVYIAEAEPSNQHFFVKRRRDVAGAVASLCLGAVQTAWNLLLGLVLLRSVTHG